jgi:hypothetical protein
MTDVHTDVRDIFNPGRIWPGLAARPHQARWPREGAERRAVTRDPNEDAGSGLTPPSF